MNNFDMQTANFNMHLLKGKWLCQREEEEEKEEEEEDNNDYSQIHPALQQIPAHSTLELGLWLVSSR